MKTKIIIVQGIDNVGKSTFIDNLMKNTVVPYTLLKYSAIKGKLLSKEKIKQMSFQHYNNMFNIIQYCINNNINLILDRAHLGQVVYSQKYRNYDGNYVYQIENKFQHLMDKITLIVLTDKGEDVFNRDDKLSTYQNIEQLNEQINNFKEAYNKTNIKNKYYIKVKENSNLTYQYISNKISKEVN